MSVLLAYLIALGTRGWRCATLVASGHQVTVRGLVTTTSVQWQHIDQFVADTRPAPVTAGLPIRMRRTVLGVQMRNGQTRWFPELSCRRSGDTSSWVDISVARLSGLLAAHSPSQDGSVDELCAEPADHGPLAACAEVRSCPINLSGMPTGFLLICRL
jgi:hypothetical protein